MSDWVTSFCISHDSKLIASASMGRNETMKIWDARTGEHLRSLEGPADSALSLDFSHDSTLLVAGSSDRSVKVWDVKKGICLQKMKGHSDRVTSVCFAHDSKQVASASRDGTVRIWDTITGQCLRSLGGPDKKDQVASLDFSHDSTLLVSGSSDETVKIWDTRTGKCLRKMSGHTGKVESVCFAHDSKQVASASADYTVKIWEPKTGACLRTLEGHASSVSSVAFSYDPQVICSASADGTIKIWDITSDDDHKSRDENQQVPLVILSPDYRLLAFAFALDQLDCIKIQDANNGKELRVLETSHFISSMAFSYGSKLLFGYSPSCVATVWDLNSGQCLQTMNEHTRIDEVACVCFSDDSSLLASGLCDGTIQVWDTGTRKCLYTLWGTSQMKKISAIAFSHDSELLAYSSHEYVQIVNHGRRHYLQLLKGHRWVESVAFSRDSKLLFANSFGTIATWDISNGSGKFLQRFDTFMWSMKCISFDTTNSCLITEKGIIRLSLVSEKSREPRLEAPRFQGYGISPDGTRITFNSKDVLWLPHEYQCADYHYPCSAVSFSSVFIGRKSRGGICAQIQLPKSSVTPGLQKNNVFILQELYQR
ncbi:hypothetical protein N7468_006439 [Penicillium chermesinum]|uniref:Uncharacterized protein n=1 Tax=Penicillium chermesinum TaxID=63820 RepID=A0A9W9TJV2_9EURO|nr:uncharacterized protein N7468_006439 [Penicillium chermesinum]KAJ5225214.1 hypothetical protein N7468_006439 [Penicillium chermesinum]